MRTNPPAVNRSKTYEGAQALPSESPLAELRRAVLSCLLFEHSYYEKGSDIAARIRTLALQVAPADVATLAIEARQQYGLRHVSLWLALALVGRAVPNAAATVNAVIQRPDELAEIVALYWRDGKKRLAPSLKRGIAKAFLRFDAERLAKYDRDDAIKLRDVMFLVHPKPKDEAQAAAFKALAARTLAAPDTWEVALSSGADKRATWERLIAEDKLGALALLRNLRNMEQAKVPRDTVRIALASCRTRGVFPWQILSAAVYAPWAEPELELLMYRTLAERPKLAGRTALVVDTSPSMWDARISDKSERTRFDAAAALAMVARESCEAVDIYAFNKTAYALPPRRGFALRDVLSQTKGGYSRGGLAVEMANAAGYDRIIVITDGQWHAARSTETGDALTMCPSPVGQHAYLVNVAPYKPALMTAGKWERIYGWSDRLIDWIAASEGFSQAP